MPEITLTAEVGRTTGSRSTRRLRTEGKIPGVVYGHGTDPIPVAVGAREFQLALSGEAGLNTLLALKVGDQDLLTLARDLQRHPVRNVVTHVDFLIVRRDEVITAEVPVNLVGEALEVQHGDGIVEQLLFSIHLRAKPADIPTAIDLDITDLTIGGSLHVSDIPLAPGVELDLDAETAVVVGQPPRVRSASADTEGGTEGDAAPAGSDEG
jgi:large subunit ribosomal protein L25